MLETRELFYWISSCSWCSLNALMLYYSRCKLNVEAIGVTRGVILKDITKNGVLYVSIRRWSGVLDSVRRMPFIEENLEY